MTKLQEKVEQTDGLCFRYLSDSIIITSVQHQRPKSLIPDVMVSGFDLFQNLSL